MHMPICPGPPAVALWAALWTLLWTLLAGCGCTVLRYVFWPCPILCSSDTVSLRASSTAACRCVQQPSLGQPPRGLLRMLTRTGSPLFGALIYMDSRARAEYDIKCQLMKPVRITEEFRFGPRQSQGAAAAGHQHPVRLSKEQRLRRSTVSG